MNSKDEEIIERFIVLRSQGSALSQIAAELNVGKSTLIRWSRKYHHRIRNLQAVETEALSEDCKISRRRCLENLGEDIQRIREELARRDLKDVSTARLFLLSARLRHEAARLNGPLKLSEPLGEAGASEEEFSDPTIQWED